MEVSVPQWGLFDLTTDKKTIKAFERAIEFPSPNGDYLI